MRCDVGVPLEVSAHIDRLADGCRGSGGGIAARADEGAFKAAWRALEGFVKPSPIGHKKQ